MASFLFSNLLDGSSTGFDPNVDVLTIDGTGPVYVGTGPLVASLFDLYPIEEGPNAGRGIVFEQMDANGQTIKSIELLFSVSPDPLNALRITSSNIVFAGGSKLLLGDDSTSTAGDDSATLTLAGGNFDDQLISLGGSQTLNGGAGNDRLMTVGGQGGTAGGSGTDAFNGGTGTDTLALGDVAGMTQYLVNLTAGTGSVVGANPSSFTVTGIEAVDGSIVNDHIVGDAFTNWLYGLEGIDTLEGMGGNDLLYGGSESDFLYGGAGNDMLDGEEGADYMEGGLGADTYYVNHAGDDVVELDNTPSGGMDFRLDADPGSIIDTVIASVSFSLGAFVENLAVAAGAGNLTLTGNELDNALTGNASANTLMGGAGNDTLNGGAGNDNLVGGIGDDSYVVDLTLDVVTEAMGEGTDLVQSTVMTHTLAANVENLTLLGSAGISGTGNALNNAITGNSGNNTLAGGEGNDTLNGMAGTDTMMGDLGNDTYVVDVAQDVVSEESNAGVDTVRTVLSYTLGANVENLTLTGATHSHAIGNALNNVITGSAGNNTLNGGSGNDSASFVSSLVGVTVSLALAGVQNTLAGMDTLVSIENLTGSNFADRLTGNGVGNVLDGGAGVDTLIGGAGNDTYLVNSTQDVVTEGLDAGTDLVQSTAAAHTLSANVENLTLLGVGNLNGTGNTGNNVLTGNSGNNTLNGGAGNDTASYMGAAMGVTVSLAAGAQNTGSAGLDTLIGIENLTGGAQADTLTGNALANVLDGGVGVDTLTGGAGNDTYVVNSTQDVVTEAMGEGTDLVQSSASSHLLAANVENLTLLGTGNLNGTGNTLNNLFTGNAGNNVMSGSNGTDTVSYVAATAGVTVSLATAGAQNTVGAGLDTLVSIENLTGGNFADALTGNANGNTLNGGLGSDTLTGGAGPDTYLFNSTLGATNIDTISGYVAVDDTIRLENAIFTSLITPGALSGMSFRSGAGITTAADADDFIIYNTSNGQLFYDADGNGAGASQHFATLTGAPAGITAADFLVV